MRRFIGIMPEDVEQTLAQSLPQAGDETAQANGSKSTDTRFQ
jgi:hypothetical protein